VKHRPHLKETLEYLRKHYELILFTAANSQYANIILQTFEGHQYFDYILTRDQCIRITECKAFVKDLTILTNGRSLKDVIIVDNNVGSYSSNLENGIFIKSFFGQPNDNMLRSLRKYLMKFKEVEDVRECLLKDFFLD
jgi:Dullard-like phosphatase family protein